MFQVDGSGTVAAEDRLKSEKESSEDVALTNGNSNSQVESAVPINENLFLDEDLDALDDELEDLDLNE